MERVKLEISIWSVIKLLLILAAFYLVFLIKDIIALFAVVLILVTAFNPIVSRWEKKVGRVPAVLILVLIAIILITAFVYIVVPPLVSQTKQLLSTLPSLIDSVAIVRHYVPSINEGLSTIAKGLGNITSNIYAITAGVFGGVFTFFMAIILTVYLLLDKAALSKTAYSFIPEDKRLPVAQIVKKITAKIGDWFRGELILMGSIGILSYVGLLVIGVPFALTLALIAGLLEIVPTIGPVIAAILAIIVAFLDQPYKALLVLVFYIILQQLENNILVPKIMQKVIGISPVIIILAILIGAKLFGIIGAVLAVPLVGTLVVLIQEWPRIKEILANNERQK